jgi:hypothetical protein
MPLSVTKLPKFALQPLVDQVDDKLSAWKGRLTHRSGRLTLIKTTLCVMLIYTSISIRLPGWLLKALWKIMRVFLCTRTEVIQNGKCLVESYSKTPALRGLGSNGLKTPWYRFEVSLASSFGARVPMGCPYHNGLQCFSDGKLIFF